MSPFRLRRRIGLRPAIHGVDATAKVVGAAPFVEPERRFDRRESGRCPPRARFRRMNRNQDQFIRRTLPMLSRNWS